jgi:ABC-type Fe3+/spermidine/putrescine transport system ATPase subunit
MSNRLAVMRTGRIEQVGRPREIYEAPRSKFVADFIGQSNFFEGEVIANGPDATLVRERGGFTLRCAPAEWARAGATVSVAVRPEKIAPAGPMGAANVVTGRLERRTYLGDLVRFHVVVPGGREVLCQRQNEPDDRSSAWQIGADVDLAWEQNSAKVVLDERVAGEDDLHLLADDARELAAEAAGKGE